MPFTIAAWNVETRLSDRGIKGRGSVEQIVGEIESMDADIILLPEAYDGAIGIDHRAESIFAAMYPTIIDVPYEEIRENGSMEANQIIYRVMTRLAVSASTIIRPANVRNVPYIRVVDPTSAKEVSMYPTHLDDQRKTTRKHQVTDLVRAIVNDSYPVLVMGDFNESRGMRKMLRAMDRPFVEHIIKAVPLREIRYVAQRAIGMVRGDTLAYFEEQTGFVNANLRGIPTTTAKLRGISEMLPAIPIFDIDQTYSSEELEVTDYRIMDHDGGSDHRAQEATIHLLN